ncbi:MAG: Unknown protein [uncultured Sulfurovum sp.]|uniref:Uncharacterized protein n=1 Tax=uncultured Sulfurovum sp. TaxID=269237 RepID=A0A6S6T5J6_9BACT|nr:MAG: Unknown protein [uncultured Sulfurovum sp.]
MKFLDKITKATEHKLIDNIITIWKKLKPSKGYWVIASSVIAFIFSQSRSWQWAEALASYADKQTEYVTWWKIVSSIAIEFAEPVDWGLVGLGVFVLIVVTYAFGKESDLKSYDSVLKEVRDNTLQNDYFVRELERKNSEIDSLSIKLKNSFSENERINLSYKMEKLVADIEDWKKKAKELQARLNEYSSEVEIVENIEEILSSKGINEALNYLESIDFTRDEVRNEENAKALLIQADLYNLRNEYMKAEETYKKSIKFNRTFSNSLDFVNYLSKQNNVKEALRQLNIMKLEVDFSENEKLIYLGSVANSHAKQNQLEEAEKAYLEALALYRALAKTNPSAYNPDVATTLNNLAVLYRARNQLEEAEKAYLEALALYRALAKTNPSAYNPDVAMTLNNLAVLYSNRNQLEEAEKAYLEALALYRDLAKTNPSAYNPDVAMTLNNLAVLYRARNQLEEAEKAYLEALALYRDLAKTNPSAYNPDVATTLNNLAVLYSDRNQLEEAEKAYLEALALRRDLAKTNPSAYNPDVATTLNNLAILYRDRNQLEEAEKAYLEALALRRDLAKTNPSAYNPDVATTLNNLAILYRDRNQLEEAEKAYLEALALRRDLAKTNPSAYGIDCANTLIMGVDLLDQPKEYLDEAEKLLKVYDGVYGAERLLRIIKQVRGR